MDESKRLVLNQPSELADGTYEDRVHAGAFRSKFIEGRRNGCSAANLSEFRFFLPGDGQCSTQF